MTPPNVDKHTTAQAKTAAGLPAPKRVSLALGKDGKVGAHVKLSTIEAALKGENDIAHIGDRTRALRKAMRQGDAAAIAAAKEALPVMQAGGLFTIGDWARIHPRAAQPARDGKPARPAKPATLEHDNHIAIVDLDHAIDGSDLTSKQCRKLHPKLAMDPRILFLAPSARGKLWALIRVEGDRKSAYALADEHFKKHYGIAIYGGAEHKIDQSSIDRKRFLAVAEDPAMVVRRKCADTVPFVGDQVEDTEQVESTEMDDSAEHAMADITPGDVEELLAYIDPFCQRPKWVKLVLALKAQLGSEGRELAQKWSAGELSAKGHTRGESNYVESELHRLWDSAKRGGGVKPQTLIWAAKENGYNPTREAYSKAGKLAVSLGIDRRYVVLTSGEVRFINLETLCEHSQRALDSLLQVHFLDDAQRREGVTLPKISPSRLLLNVLQIPRVVDECYLPARPPIVEIDGRQLHNRWRDDGAVPIPRSQWTPEQAEDVKRIVKHFEWMLGKRNCHILLSYLHLVLLRRQRIHWALLIAGPEGIGKSFIVKLMGPVLGVANCGPVGFNQLTSDNPFNDSCCGRELIVIEEIRGSDFNKTHTAVEKLKELIANPRVIWHRKGKTPVTIDNVTNYMALTNSYDALPLGEGDRRYCITRSVTALRSEFIDDLGGEAKMSEYFNQLFSAAARSAGAVRQFLLDYDPADVCATTAPKTVEKRLLIRAQRPPLETAIEQYCAMRIKAGEGTERGKPIALHGQHLLDHLHTDTFDGVEGETQFENLSGQALGRALRKMGYECAVDDFRFPGSLKKATIYVQHTLWRRRPKAQHRIGDFLRSHGALRVAGLGAGLGTGFKVKAGVDHG